MIGTPDYSVESGAPNAFPNPCSDPDYSGRGSYEGLPRRLSVTFTHLPKEATIVIVLGRLPEARTQEGTSTVGVTLPAAKAKIERTIRKDDPSPFIVWDLTDEMAQPVPSGVYRAHYYGPTIDGIHFIDISIERKTLRIDRW